MARTASMQPPGDQSSRRPGAADNPEEAARIDAPDIAWKILGRFDFYIGSTNAKAALLIAFNTFVTGTIVLKGQDVSALFGRYRMAYSLAVLALFVGALASVASMWLTFKVIRPYLDSARSPTQYHSVLFFNHVAEHANLDEYRSAVQGLDEDALTKDLTAQAHALAVGLRSKFATMRQAVNIILYVQLPAIGLVILLLFGSIAWDLLSKVAAP